VSGRWAGQPSPCRLAGRPAGSNNSPTGQERPRQAGRRPQQRDRAPCQRALRGAPSPRAHLLAASRCCCCWGPRSDPCCRHARTMTTTQAAHDRHTTHSFTRSRVLRPWMSGRSCSKFGGLVTSSQPAGPMVRASLWVAAAFASSRSRSGSVFTSSSARPLG
jgi:hypothetical protein